MAKIRFNFLLIFSLSFFFLLLDKKMIDSSKYYLFYDGGCGLCNRWVQWVLRNDKKDRFRFAALQSDFGKHFLSERGLDIDSFSTLYLWKPDAFYLTKSDAVLEISRLLGGRFYPIYLGKIIPRFVRNAIYDKVAERRMKLVSPHCMVPTAEERRKFVSELSPQNKNINDE